MKTVGEVLRELYYDSNGEFKWNIRPFSIINAAGEDMKQEQTLEELLSDDTPVTKIEDDIFYKIYI